MIPHRKVMAMTGLCLLTACSQQQSEQVQQAASAAIGAAHNSLQASSAPLAALRQQASNVTAEAKQHAATLLTENPALGNAVAILKQASGKADGKQQWQALEHKVGKYPADIGLYQTGAVAEALRQLLGSKFAVFQQNMQVSGPLSRDQLLYVSGNKPHEGGSEMAYLLLDPASRQLEVGLVEQGKLTVYRSGPALYRPAEITTILSNIDGQP